MMLCLFFVFVLTDYQFAFKPVNAVQHHQTAVNDLQGRLRSVEGLQCQLPPPLHNGVFKPSHRRCNPPHNSSSYCRMEPYAQVAPDTPVYYECNPGYSLNTKQGVTNKKSASICRNGQWSPEFPTCVESHHNSNNLPQFQSTSSYCGKPAKLSRAKRNADGTVSRKGAWPWMAIFGTRTNSTQNSGIHWFCAGTLVTTRHILTSAHCFADYRRRNSFFVRFNDIDLDSAADNVGILDIEIQRNNIIIHPGFKEEKIFSHNLAIIKLNTDLPITDYIRPACLPTPDFADKTFDNQTVYFTSWGQTDNDREWNRKRRYQPILKEYQASIVNLIECNHNYRGYQSDDFVIIGWDLLCASVPDNIRCKGDAGSPLMLKVKDSYVVMGVVATQFRCYDELYPRLFTRLSMYMDWIIANLKI